MKKLSFFIILVFLFSFLNFFIVKSFSHVFADSIDEINEEKSKKQEELDVINKEISSIATSKASITSKLNDLKKERKKLQKLSKEMELDINDYELELKSQETELVNLANQYSLNKALYYVESQKSIFITVFEAPNISQVLDRMLYYSVQEKLMSDQREYIEIKLDGLEVTKEKITSDKKAIQNTISKLNKTIAELEDQQTRLALALSQSYAQSNALSSDIKNLSAAAKDILNKKSNETKPPSGGVGTGTGGGGAAPPPPVITPNPSGAISILVNGELLERTDNVVKIQSSNNNTKLIGAKTGNFAGTIIFDRNAGTFAINSLSVDQYLWGLAEMPSSWPEEALKVQAVAGRSYAVYKMVNGGYGKFDIYDSVRDQEFIGLSKINSSYGSQWKDAVNDTSNQILKYNGSLVQAFYSAESGGHTLASTESPSFGGYRDYLKAKPDRYLDGDVWKAYGNSSLSYWLAQSNTNTMALMEDYINGAIYYQKYGKVKAPSEQSDSALKTSLGDSSIQSKVGTIASIDQIYNTGSNVIEESSKFTKELKIVGSDGEFVVGGAAFKASYNVRSPGSNALWSTLYDIKKINDNKWEMWSRGWGHRVGMSQYGAYGRAKAGQNYSDILSYYYNGANVVEYSVGRNIKVALEKYGSRVMKLSSTGDISIYDGGSLLKEVSPNIEIKIEYN